MIGGETGRPVSNSTGPGTPIPIPQQRPRPVNAASASHSSKSSSTRVSTRVGPVRDRARLLHVRQDRAGEIGDRDVHARRAEVGDEQVPGVGAEADQPRRPPAGRAAELADADEPVLDELEHALSHHRAAEAGRLDQAGAGGFSVHPDVVEHGYEAVRRDRAVPKCL